MRLMLLVPAVVLGLVGAGTVAARAAEAPAGPPVVDVLMLYTPQAAQESGGEAVLRDIADRAAASVNAAFTRSEANVRTRIVGVAPAPDYNPPGGKEDGYDYLFHKPASAGRIRDRYKADVVGLFAADTGGFSNAVSRPVPRTS